LLLGEVEHAHHAAMPIDDQQRRVVLELAERRIEHDDAPATQQRAQPGRIHGADETPDAGIGMQTRRVGRERRVVVAGEIETDR